MRQSTAGLSSWVTVTNKQTGELNHQLLRALRLEVQEQSVDNLGAERPNANLLVGHLPPCAHVIHPWHLMWTGLWVAAGEL